MYNIYLWYTRIIAFQIVRAKSKRPKQSEESLRIRSILRNVRAHEIHADGDILGFNVRAKLRAKVVNQTVAALICSWFVVARLAA